MDRFNQIKQLFEIVDSVDATQFGIKNHGGLVCFAGCKKSGAWQSLSKTPRRYSTITENLVNFHFSQKLKEKDSLILYYRDIDLNAYKVKVAYKDRNFCKDLVVPY